MKTVVDPANSIRFNNNVDFCVGTGRLGLALTAEYLDELKKYKETVAAAEQRWAEVLDKLQKF